MSGFPYRVNGTGCEVRSDTIRQLTRRGLVSYHVFFNGGEWRDEYRITEAVVPGAMPDVVARWLERYVLSLSRVATSP